MTRNILTVFLLLFLVVTVSGQRRRSDPRLPPFSVPDCRPGDRICEDQKTARDKALNKERQEKLKADTDKLYQLATELKAAVDKTNENMLSLEVVRKAEEIEKLAKEVKKKMKNE